MGERIQGLVLIAHCDEIARYLWCRYLRQAGFDVREASTGAEALALVERESVDLAMINVELPDMSGYELGRQLWQNRSASPIRLLYASEACASADRRLEGLAAGGDASMTLPIDRDELITTVTMLLCNRLPDAPPEGGAWSWQALSSGVDGVMSVGPAR